MDLSEEELNGITNLEGVRNWAGIGDELNTKLLEKLGQPTKLRDIGFMSRPTWDRAVMTLRMEVPVPVGAPDGTLPGERELSPVEESRVEVYRRVALLRLGIKPDNPGDPSIPTALVGIQQLPPAGGGGGAQSPPTSSPTRKLKMSSVVDPTLDAEIVQLDPGEITAMYAVYKQKFGAYRSQDVEPTGDQLSALSQFAEVQSGALRGPFCMGTACISYFEEAGIHFVHPQRCYWRMV